MNNGEYKSWWEYRMDEMMQYGVVSIRITTFMLHILMGD